MELPSRTSTKWPQSLAVRSASPIRPRILRRCFSPPKPKRPWNIVAVAAGMSFLLSILVFLFALPGLLFVGVQQKSVEGRAADLDSLLFVHAIWRHGDRTPSKMIPSDKVNTLDKWKEKFGGLGQLTDQGALQHFRLGKMLRKRYDGFLPKEYSPEAFIYRSSDYNRTKMSAIANLQGMFSATGQEAPKLPLEANAPKGLSLGFLPQGHDLLVFDEVECSAASKAEDKVFNSTEFLNVQKANEGLLKFIGEQAGFGQVPHPLRRIYYVHDPLNSIFLHKNDGFVFPSWVNESTRAQIFRLYNLKNSFDFKEDVHKRLWSGPLFTDIVHRMKRVAGGTYHGKEKFHAYSGHDLTIAGLLAIFGIYPEVFPTYANAVLIELHLNKNSANVKGRHGRTNGEGAPFVRLFHKNETEGSRLWEYEIPGCGKPCTLDELEKSRKSFLIELADWDRECGLSRGLKRRRRRRRG